MPKGRRSCRIIHKSTSSASRERQKQTRSEHLSAAGGNSKVTAKTVPVVVMIVLGFGQG